MVHQLTPAITPDQNKALAAFIKSIQRANQAEEGRRQITLGDGGAWASQKKLFLSDNPAVVALKAEIDKALSEVTSLAASEWEVTGWAVILCDEDKITPHDHEWHDYTRPDDPCSRNTWAGIYYVQTPGGGPITFGQLGHDDQGIPTLKVEGREEIEPKEGMLLLFDALLAHKVVPHKKPERERISIAFNVRKAPKD